MSTALTPLDGRYAKRVADLIPFLSEQALMRHRVIIEVEWLKKLLSTIGREMTPELEKTLDHLVDKFDENSALEVRTIEAKVNHDVKAVELWISNMLAQAGHQNIVPLVHFARTSEDINNLSYALMLKGTRNQVILPSLRELHLKLSDLASTETNSVMLARTHGQPATPTTLGKELSVFSARLDTQISAIETVKIYGKCNGATGTYAADRIAHPDINWVNELKQFVESLGLKFNPLTTQIEPHDWIARLNNEMALVNTIGTDLARDCWQYISVGYLTQKSLENEVGSSTMPHKINPIDFENAEANFGIANALLNHLSAKLPISRLQRDLSDSSALRSLSEAYGHMLIGLSSLTRGLSKVSGNPQLMNQELENEWAILTEAVQTVMRKNGIVDAYQQMKSLSRGRAITKDDLHAFITNLDIDAADKQTLLELTPASYIGYAREL